jgi:transcription elongation factor Elf1
MSLEAARIWNKYPKVTDSSMTCKRCGLRASSLAVVHCVGDPQAHSHFIYCRECLEYLNYPQWGPCTCKELVGVRR